MFELLPFRKGANNLMNRGEYFDRLFNTLLSDEFLAPLNMAAGPLSPFRVDIKETDATFIFEADLPGFKKEAITVDFNNEELSISARRDDTVEEETGSYIRRERHFGEFKRVFHVGKIDREAIKASYNDGVLIVEVPKNGKEPEKKTIEIT